MNLFGEKPTIEEVEEAKKKEPGLFDIINDINYNKSNLLRKGDIQKLNRFMVLKGMSNSMDNIFYANELNQVDQYIDDYMFYDYLINSVRKMKRFDKWTKSVNDDDVNNIIDYFQYSYEKALAVLDLFSEEQLLELKQKLNKGGLQK